MLYKICLDFLTKVINDFLTVVYGGTNTYINPLILPTVAAKYDLTVLIASRVLAVSFIFAIIAWRLSFDMFSVRKLIHIIRDMVVAAFFLQFAKFFIGKAHDFSNIVSLAWVTSNSQDIAKAILGSVGLNSNFTPPADYGLWLLLALCTVILTVIILIIEHTILDSLFQLAIILLPLILGFYSLDYTKNIMQKWLAFYIGLLIIGPMQSLAISLFFASASEMTFWGICGCLGKLIVVTFLTIGAVFFLFSASSNAKVIE